MFVQQRGLEAFSFTRAAYIVIRQSSKSNLFYVPIDVREMRILLVLQ